MRLRTSPAPPQSRSARAVALGLAAALALGACSGAATSGASAPAPAPAPAPEAERAAPARPDQPWPIKSREHVDLWLHGFALLSTDTARVPYFRPGYRDDLIVQRNQRNVTTRLDTNRERLAARLASVRSLVNAQFVALYFDSWADLRDAVTFFVRAEGDVSRTSNREARRALAVLATYFPTAADRDWLELFVSSLDDESTRFHHAWWLEQQQARRAVLAAVDSLWQQRDRPRLQRFLNNTRQETGDVFLALPLDGEGRTITLGARQNAVAVGFPERPAEAVEAIYALVHELAGAVVGVVVEDHTTPAERRSGVVERYLSAGLVRGGLLLLERTAPELATGYARYYLRVAKQPATGDPKAALAAAFPLPREIVEAMDRQIEVVLGGI